MFLVMTFIPMSWSGFVSGIEIILCLAPSYSHLHGDISEHQKRKTTAEIKMHQRTSITGIENFGDASSGNAPKQVVLPCAQRMALASGCRESAYRGGQRLAQVHCAISERGGLGW